MQPIKFNPQPKTITPKKAKKPWRYVNKPTGEKEVFESIWNERPHLSQVNDEPLGDEANVCFFAHILPKGKNKYPEFKLNKQNIVLMSFDQHHLWDNGSRGELRLLPEWDKIFELEASLKEQYKLLHG